MRILYVLGEELKLTRKEINNGIAEFEKNAHIVDTRKPVRGIIRKMKKTFDLKSRVAGLDPIGYVRNRWSEIEPLYILDWAHIHPAKSVKGNEVLFESELNYKMTPEMLKILINLKMDRNLLSEEPFMFRKKWLLIIGIAVVMTMFIVWYFTSGGVS